jgi:hypothetical protein
MKMNMGVRYSRYRQTITGALAYLGSLAMKCFFASFMFVLIDLPNSTINFK